MKCLFCFNETAKLYFDKKSRPYYFCPLCSHRIFIHSPIALKAVLIWAETAKALTQQEFVNMLQRVENNQVFQHCEVQKWVHETEKTEEVISKKG